MSIISKLAEIVSHIHWPYSRRKMSYDTFVKIKSSLKNGDIILTSTKGELSNLFIGQPSHAGIYFNGYVYEAILTGISKTDLGFFLARKDVASVWSLKSGISYEDASLATAVLDQIVINKTKYDLEFSSKNKSFYCFELVAEVFNVVLRLDNVKPIETLLGDKYMAESFTKNTSFIQKI